MRAEIHTIREGQAGHSRLADELESHLLADLRKTLPQAVNQAFALEVQDDRGRLLAGLTAGSAYGWLLIKILWVHEDHRCKGFGRQLVTQAEAEARGLGCHGTWLDTSNPSAKSFYEKLGYVVFGELANSGTDNPPEHHRWFMHRRF